MKFEIDYIDNSQIEQQFGIQSTFRYLNEVELNYKYIREPNNGLIELEIELLINNKNVIPEIGLSKSVFLPNQYPSSFDLINESKSHISFPYNDGIYLLELSTSKIELINYTKSKINNSLLTQYIESFFYDNYFILVGKDNFLLYNIASKDRNLISFEFDDKEKIQTIKIINKEIIISIVNHKNEIYKYFLISKLENANNNTFKKYFLSDYIDDSNFNEKFQIEHIRTLAGINNFKNKSIIDSWTPLSKFHNRLLGQVNKYDDCEIDQNGKITRKDSSNYIEIKIKNEC